MNRISYLTFPNFVGIFELDSVGTVLSSRQSNPCPVVEVTKPLIGQNFFDSVADFENVPDFRRRFKTFFHSGHSTENFLFDCHSNDESFPVRVLMLKASENNNNQTNKFVIVDIRKNES